MVEESVTYRGRARDDIKPEALNYLVGFIVDHNNPLNL
jgi:hypothetical protein